MLVGKSIGGRFDWGERDERGFWGEGGNLIDSGLEFIDFGRKFIDNLFRS